MEKNINLFFTFPQVKTREETQEKLLFYFSFHA